MKIVILILIILINNSINACENSQWNISNVFQLGIVEDLQTETDDCCDGLCFCNCCNQLTGFNAIVIPIFYVNNSNLIKFITVQNLKNYANPQWHPPKLFGYSVNKSI